MTKPKSQFISYFLPIILFLLFQIPNSKFQIPNAFGAGNANFQIDIDGPGCFAGEVSGDDEELFTYEVFNYTTGGSAVVNRGDGETLEFSVPVNFYTDSVCLGVFVYANNYYAIDKPAPSGKEFVGKTYDFKFEVYDGSATVAALDEEMSVTLPYTSAELVGYTESSLAPYKYDNGAWSVVSSSTLDTNLNTISFAISSSSPIVILGEPLPEGADPEPDIIISPSDGGGYPFPSQVAEEADEPFVPNCDFTGDDLCNIRDLSILLYWFEKTGPGIIPYDLNQDRKINFQDLSIFLYHWRE